MIEVSALSKRFRTGKRAHSAAGDPREEGKWFHAVRNVSFHCAPGEALGLLGPNGAGKTTTLRMLSTAIAPSAGTVRVGGVDMVADPIAARRNIGFLSGQTGLYGRLTARENIRYFGEAHGLSGARLNARVEELLSKIGMLDYADRLANTLSAGMKQRVAIARTVVHSPNVLILDEPTTGLDILGAKIVMDFMRERSENGDAVVFSTHHLHEVDALCRHVCIIDQGTTVYEGEVEALRSAGGSGGLAAGYMAQLTAR